MRNGALSFAFLSIALFGSLYFLAIPLGTWPSVLAIHTVTTLAFVIAWVRYRSTFVGVSDDRLEYHGFFRFRWSVPRSTVASVTVVHTYLPNAADTSPQLLARDAEGRRVLRMRGRFWHEEDMHRIADALGFAVDEHPEPMTTRDFLATYPGSASWFEARPVALVITTAVFLVIAGTSVIGLMALTGVAVGLN